MSKYYGGTITVNGRNLITSLMAGETIEFTRVVVGSGDMPEGVEPIDMTGLVNPVAEGTSTVPSVDSGVMYMTVEYRNDMNGGLSQGFWLREFGVFAKTEKSEEILLYYATLGDSPQPVNAYKDNRIDIRRYPISIALELDADVQVTYNPGAFITASEAKDLLGAMFSSIMHGTCETIITDIIIPHAGWSYEGFFDEQSCSIEQSWYIDVPVTGVTAEHFPNIALHRTSLETAGAAGLCPSAQTMDGTVRFWAESIPEADIYATAAFMRSRADGSGSSGSAEGGMHYVIPVATSTAIGGVMVKPGSGLLIDDKGSLSVDAASKQDVAQICTAKPAEQ